MAQNITLLGAQYNAVPAVDLPKTGGGTARFTDTTPTTATESDVASGKIFIKADGSQATGTASGGGGVTDTVTQITGGGDFHDISGQAISGTLNVTTNGTYDVTSYASAEVNVSGGGGGQYPWLADGAEYLQKIYDQTLTLDDTTYSSWTPSTTARVILAAESNVATLPSVDFSQYVYYLVARMYTNVAFLPGATMSNTVSGFARSAIYSTNKQPTNYTNLINGAYAGSAITSTANTYLLTYYSGGSLFMAESVTYGPAYGGGFTISVSGGNTINVTRAAISARCDASYFATSRATEVDTTNTTIHLRVDAFRAPVPGNKEKTYRFITDMYNGASWDF